MFKQLIVTLDGTPRSEAILPHAVDLARAMSGELTLLRVVQAGRGGRGALGEIDLNATAHSPHVVQARTYLENLANGVRGTGVVAHTLVKQGAPAEAIVEAATEMRADLIVMATRARRGLNKLMLGSVAETVLHEAIVPVLLVRA